MSQLTIEFPLSNDAAVLGATHLTPEGELLHISINLGNGVKLNTTVPTWVKHIKEVKLQVVMEIEGSPPQNAESSKASVE